MGFASGFTGGVTLTLSVAYFTVAAHQRNRQQQCEALRANTNVLRALTLSNPAAAAQLAEQTGATPAAADPATPSALAPVPQYYYYYYQNSPAPSPPRSDLVEELKDRWNAEVSGAVRKVQTTDWVAVREAAEASVAQLWTRAFGSGTPAGDAASAVKGRVVSAAETAKAEAQAGAKSLQATASQAIQRGKDALGVVEPANLTEGSDAATSEVKRALQQRFKSTSEPLETKKSVDALLEERYRHKV